TKTNLALSEARARAVRDYIRDRFFGHPSFASTLQALGVHPSSQAAGSTAAELNEFRRVDIIAPPSRAGKITATHSTPTPTCPSAREFRIRIKVAVGAGVPIPGIPKVGLGFENLLIEIHDPTNRRGMNFEYVGDGPSLGTPSLSGASGLITFTTSIPVCLEDFKGPAAHTGGLIGAGISASFDLLDLLGPFHRRGADPVLLTFPAGVSGLGP